ncbi:MAG: rhodanese-like domain-containing protein [Sedimenticola sp.]
MRKVNSVNFFQVSTLVTTLLLLAISSVAMAAEEGGEVSGGGDSYVIPLYKGKPYLHVLHEGRSIKVQRVQDVDYQLRGYFAKTIRKCPPFCIVDISVDPRVKTVGEIEVFEFMENQLRDGIGLLVDARTQSWFEKGTIPGSASVPFTVLSKENTEPEMIAALESFGAKKRGEVGAFTSTMEKWGVVENVNMTQDWDFSSAKELVLWCNGPACGQSPRAIKGLLKAGYPAAKIYYYRGGMQIWQLFGLTTVTPQG